MAQTETSKLRHVHHWNVTFENIFDDLSLFLYRNKQFRIVSIVNKKGSGALSSKLLLGKIVENNEIDADLGQVRLSKG